MPVDGTKDPPNKKNQGAEFEDTRMCGLAGPHADDMTKGRTREAENMRSTEAGTLGLVVWAMITGQPDIVTPLLGKATNTTHDVDSDCL